MKRILTLATIALFLPPSAALSQTRSRTTTKRHTAKTRKATAQPAADQVRTEGATRVANQLKNLTKFVYLLGGVAKGIESVDEAARRNEASPAVLAQNDKNKAAVRSSLRDERDARDQLEIYFRATPELEQYYVKLAGSAAGAATAEEQAGAGHFDQAGRTLLGVVNRLTDVLLAMR